MCTLTKRKQGFTLYTIHFNPLQIQLATFHWKIFIGFSRLTDYPDEDVSLRQSRFLLCVATLKCNVALFSFFFTVTAAFCLPISMQPNHQQINNVPQRTLLALWISSTHGCAAAHTLIIFCLSISFFSYAFLLHFHVRNSFFFLAS